jgi:ornithine decarboxylase
MPNVAEDKPLPTCADVAGLLAGDRPSEPVYCIYPEIYRNGARAFVAGFPGRVLYAVKANDHPEVIRLLHQGGVRHFDCASIAEIAQVQRLFPDACCYFMVPVRLRGAAREAFERYGVRHFMVDHADGIELLAAEIDLSAAVVFVRMAVHHKAALQDLSAKYGAPPAAVAGLLQTLAERGAEPALAFNVGSSVIRTEAYTHSLGVAAKLLRELPFRLRLVDIGGGFPHPYPGFPVPALPEYFESIAAAARELPLATAGEIMAEPGRALAAPGLSAVVEVLLRKGDRLYLNDGMYGIFWELRFKEHEGFPLRVYRDGRVHQAPALQPFRLYGPTCDASDFLPSPIALPADIRIGDFIEFGSLGAYSLGGRTRFNGYYSERVVIVTGVDARPPR